MSGPFPQQYICEHHLDLKCIISFIHCPKSTRGSKGPGRTPAVGEAGGGGWGFNQSCSFFFSVLHKEHLKTVILINQSVNLNIY